jgi:hypothetical protein
MPIWGQHPQTSFIPTYTNHTANHAVGKRLAYIFLRNSFRLDERIPHLGVQSCPGVQCKAVVGYNATEWQVCATMAIMFDLSRFEGKRGKKEAHCLDHSIGC